MRNVLFWYFLHARRKSSVFLSEYDRARERQAGTDGKQMGWGPVPGGSGL